MTTVLIVIAMAIAWWAFRRIVGIWFERKRMLVLDLLADTEPQSWVPGFELARRSAGKLSRHTVDAWAKPLLELRLIEARTVNATPDVAVLVYRLTPMGRRVQARLAQEAAAT